MYLDQHSHTSYALETVPAVFQSRVRSSTVRLTILVRTYKSRGLQIGATASTPAGLAAGVVLSPLFPYSYKL